MWRKLQQRDPAAFPRRADKGMATLESLTQTFPLTDPKVLTMHNSDHVIWCIHHLYLQLTGHAMLLWYAVNL